jgi:antitoxin CcdA
MTTVATKRTPVNVTVQAGLLAEAKALQINLSQTLEVALQLAVQDARQTAWLAQNQQGIEALNASVASHGVFSRGRRTF